MKASYDNALKAIEDYLTDSGWIFNDEYLEYADPKCGHLHKLDIAFVIQSDREFSKLGCG